MSFSGGSNGGYMKVKIKNYQAIKDATLEFNKGLTAIIGTTNAGKSSIIRAIESAINNKAGNGFINYDANECQVIIEAGDNVVEWSKKTTGAGTYTLNGSTITKIGRSQNEEVAAILNMQEVQVNENKIRLNFWKQMEYPFLVGYTPNQLFNFISKSSEQEYIKQFQETKQGELKSIDDEIKKSYTAIDIRNDDILQTKSKINTLEVYLKVDSNELKQLVEFEEALNETINKIDKINTTIEETTHSLVGPSKKVVGLKVILDGMADDLQFVLNGEELLNKIDGLEVNIVETGTMNDTTKKVLEVLSDKSSKLEDTLNTIKSIENSLLEALSIESSINTLDTNINSIKTQIKDTLNKLETINTELKEFTVCPLCGHPLTDMEHNHGE